MHRCHKQKHMFLHTQISHIHTQTHTRNRRRLDDIAVVQLLCCRSRLPLQLREHEVQHRVRHCIKRSTNMQSDTETHTDALTHEYGHAPTHAHSQTHQATQQADEIDAAT